MSEAALCREFISWIKPQGYKVYPEVQNWDIVLEPTDEVRYRRLLGRQIGIHAKLRAGVDVLAQCLGRGPETRAVLVPWASPEFIAVAETLEILVITKYRRSDKRRGVYEEEGFQCRGTSKIWTTTPFWVPPIETDRPCGVQSPQSLTQWRVKALQICNIFETKGVLTSADFKAIGINITRWVQAQWLIPLGKMGRLTTYALGANHPGLGWESESSALKQLTTPQIQEILIETNEES